MKLLVDGSFLCAAEMPDEDTLNVWLGHKPPVTAKRVIGSNIFFGDPHNAPVMVDWERKKIWVDRREGVGFEIRN